MTGTQAIYREREITSLSRTVVTHTDSEHYIVNTASLHNYGPISSTLPSHLRKSSFHVDSESTLRNTAAYQIQLAKRKSPPSPSVPTTSSAATEVPLAIVEGRTTPAFRNGDVQPDPTSDNKREASPHALGLFHRPKDKAQKGKAKLATSRKRNRTEAIGASGLGVGEGSMPAKKKKGAVEETSRRENERQLRGLF